jgi:N-acetylmuramoyl-L-alanine amidase
MFTFKNHVLQLLTDDPSGKSLSFVYSPNYTKAPSISPSLLVVHYTAGGPAATTAAWCHNPDSQVSYHLIIDRDGSVIQLVPFNKAAWHAGRSYFQGQDELNHHSIGIALANWGPLKRHADGTFWAWPSDWSLQVSPHITPQLLAHKHDKANAMFWDPYTPAQIQTLSLLVPALTHAYNLTWIVGHDDIAPGRKSDPGPAFLPLPVNIRADLSSPLVQRLHPPHQYASSLHYWMCSVCPDLPCILCSRIAEGTQPPLPAVCPLYADGRATDWEPIDNADAEEYMDL